MLYDIKLSISTKSYSTSKEKEKCDPDLGEKRSI